MTGMVRYREQKTLVEVLVILFWQLTEMTLIMETYMKRLQRTEWRLVSHGPLLNILEQDPFCVIHLSSAVD